MIYTLFGRPVGTVRFATLADVKRLDKVDREARQAVRERAWVVIPRENGSELLTHIAKLRADGGISEILKASQPAGTESSNVR